VAEGSLYHGPLEIGYLVKASPEMAARAQQLFMKLKTLKNLPAETESSAPPPLECEPPHKRLARLKPIKDWCSIQGNAIPATRRSPGNQSGTSKGPAPGTDAVRTSADQTESL
jgi:hypothetical protein